MNLLDMFVDVRTYIGDKDKSQLQDWEVRRFIEKANEEFSRVCPRRERTILGIHKEVHKVKDDANVVSVVDASNLATANALLNDIKAKYNAHRVATTYHRTADTVNVISSSDASDLSTGLVLAAEIMTDFNAHQIQSTIHMVDDTFNVVLGLPPVNEATLILAANDCKESYNDHLCQDTYGRELYVGTIVADADFIRFEAVEYPIGCVPQERALFDYRSGNFLTIEDYPIADTGSLVFVFWQARHKLTNDVSTIPVQYEQVVKTGAEAYCLLFSSVKQYRQAITDMATMRTLMSGVSLTGASTALGKVSAQITDAGTALGKTALYLENSIDSMKAVLKKIETDGIRTGINTDLASAKTALDKVTEAGTGDLDLAKNKLNTVDFTDMDTALDAIATHMNNAATALAKVATYQEGASDSVKAWLKKIDTDAAQLRTAVATALDAAKTQLANVTNETTGDIKQARDKLAQVNMTAVTNALTNAVNQVADADSALDNAADYAGGTTNSMKAVLLALGTDGVRSAVNTALDNAKNALAKVTQATTGDLDVAKAKLDLISMTAINTALANAVSSLTAVNTALAKVATYEEGASDSAKALLAKITTDAATLRTAINTALSTAKTDLNKVTEATTGDIDMAKTKIAAVNIADAETALDAVTTHVTAADTALAKVSTYMETNADGNAKSLLQTIKTDMANLKTAINTAADACKTGLQGVGTDLTSAAAVWTEEQPFVSGAVDPSGKQYLTTWDDKINTVNIGDDVPRVGAEYSLGALQVAKHFVEKRKDLLSAATRRTEMAMGYVQEVGARINHLQTYISQASGWGEVAQSFMIEAGQRLGEADTRIKEAVQRLEMNNQYLGQAVEYLAVAQKRQEGAIAYFQEAQSRLYNLRSYIEESSGWDKIAQAFMNEAAQRLGSTAAYLSEAQTRVQVNVNYIEQSNACLVIAARRIDVANGYGQEAAVRMSNVRSYIEESQGWGNVASAFLAEADGRMGMSRVHVDVANGYLQANVNYIQQGSAYLEVATKRVDTVAGYAREAELRLTNLSTYLEQAKGWDQISNAFLNEATQRINMAQGFAQEAAGRAEMNTNIMQQVSSFLEMATRRINVGEGYLGSANQRITNLRSYMDEAKSWGDLSAGFVAEAAQRVNMGRTFVEEASQWIMAQGITLQEGDRYLGAVERQLMTGEAFRREGSDRLDQFRKDLEVIRIEQTMLEKPHNMISRIWSYD